MKNQRLWVGLSLFFILSACILPLDFLFEEEISTLTPVQPPTDTPGETPQDASIIEESGIFAPIIRSADPFTDANAAMFAGEVTRAREAYQELVTNESEPEARAQALYGVGRTFVLERDYYGAIDAFNRILGQFPETEYAGNSYFQLGLVYEAIEEDQLAINAYSKYLELKPGPIDAYVYELIGDIAMRISDFNHAIVSYQAAQLSDPEYFPEYINLQIGKAYAGLADYTTAIQYYDAVYESTEDPLTRSTANLLAGQAYLVLDLPDDAYRNLLDSVIQYPTAPDSFTALVLLVDNEFKVDSYLRGLVDYYAGSYEAAIKAFKDYLNSDPDNNDGSAFYFLAESFAETGRTDEAIDAYDSLIDNFPGSYYWPAAWEGKADAQLEGLYNPSAAAQTLISFANISPSSPDAAWYMYKAGRILERSDDLEGAAGIWQRMMDDFPSDDWSYRGLFMAGISYYRLERYEEALSIFQRMLVLATSPDEKAKAYLWIGKCHDSTGKSDEAINAWQLGEKADPTNYYSIRSSEILKGLPPFNIDENYDLGYDLNIERPEAEVWLLDTFNIPLDEDLSGLGDLGTLPAIQRIQTYWDLGLYRLANKEAESLRNEVSTDILNTYRLMNYMLDLHLYQPAIYACWNILERAGLNYLSALSAPIYFTHIRFGAYFRETIVSSATEFDIPPLLLFSLIRQESLFNPHIYSSIGASGLAQIVPSTGQENADLLDWPPNYDQTDLQRGEVSARLGAFYLDRIRQSFEGNMGAALAGYNGGWGFAIDWLSLSNGDPDLFLEVIRAQETQVYLMQITEFINIYKLIYSLP